MATTILYTTTHGRGRIKESALRSVICPLGDLMMKRTMMIAVMGAIVGMIIEIEIETGVVTEEMEMGEIDSRNNRPHHQDRHPSLGLGDRRQESTTNVLQVQNPDLTRPGFLCVKICKYNFNICYMPLDLRNPKKPHIVILGAGFGGIYTFIKLRKYLSADEADITIINRTNYFLFTPLLHEVATGGLAHHQVVEAIRSITYKRGATVHVAEINSIDRKNRIVETSIGPVPYDTLVIATGATTNFYGIPGAAEHTMVLKNLYDAIKIRNNLITAFEDAMEIADPEKRKKMLTFVLVGGGATGVELAAEMAELFRDAFYKFFRRKISCDEVSIHLVASGADIIENFHPKIRDRSRMILSKVGVNVIIQAKVVSVEADGITLADGSRIMSNHVVWVAGVEPNVPRADTSFVIGRGGRMIIDKTMRVVGATGPTSALENIFALGDVATFEDEFLPTHAQAAVQESAVVAYNIQATIRNSKFQNSKLQTFQYKPIGDLLSLGQWQAVGYILRTIWTGPLAWFIWRMVYLFQFASWPKRFKIAFDWTIDIFYPRDITKA